MVTSEQIRKLFYTGQHINNCNRRLRILYDLHCIDRYFPPTEKGSSKQHIVIDRAGMLVIEKECTKINKLPLHYRHYIAVNEFVINLYKQGFGFGLREYQVAGYKIDLYYPDYKLAVEIDTGCEVHKTLIDKAKKYNRVQEVNYLLFITKGSKNRIKVFKSNVHNIKVAGCKFKDLDKFIPILKSKIK
ncbi:MAG: replication-relaxation family protein [bacterium]